MFRFRWLTTLHLWNRRCTWPRFSTAYTWTRICPTSFVFDPHSVAMTTSDPPIAKWKQKKKQLTARASTWSGEQWQVEGPRGMRKCRSDGADCSWSFRWRTIWHSVDRWVTQVEHCRRPDYVRTKMACFCWWRKRTDELSEKNTRHNDCNPIKRRALYSLVRLTLFLWLTCPLQPSSIFTRTFS